MSSETEREDNLDSAASIMLGALARASAELEKTVAILNGQLTLFNQGLSEHFQVELARIEKNFETSLQEMKKDMGGNKEALLHKLEQFKLEEIQAIRKAGFEARSGLSAQVQDSLTALNGMVSGKAAEIEGWLPVPEGQFQSKYDDNERLWSRTCDESRAQLRNAFDKEEAQLIQSAGELKTKLTEAASSAKNTLESFFQQSYESGKNNVDNISAALMQKESDSRRELLHKEQQLLVELRSKEDLLKEKLRASLVAGEKTSQTVKWSYEYSLENIAKTLAGQLENELKNIASRALTEISSNAEHVELELAGVKAEFQAELNQFQRDYEKAFESLLEKLRNAVDQETKFDPRQTSSRILKEKRYKTQFRDLIGKAGNEMIDRISNGCMQIEADFLKSVEVFERRIESVKSLACEALERETRQIKKELQQSYFDFEKQITDLELQIMRIDKAGLDAASIVATIKKANLKF